MKIAQVVLGLTIASLPFACATQRSEEPAAPAASPANAVVTSAPAAEEAPPPPAAAPAAPAPQGLDQSKRESSDSALDSEFSSLAEAEHALNQAKSDLDRLALAEPELGRSANGAEKKAAHRAASSAGGAAAPAAAAPSQCDNACRAFASLTRAANAVCRMDGDGGSHCSRAKKIVNDSALRVAACTCPAPGQ
ncbi:MAG TPA: hypothetical protein VHV51_15825 [Polyangiaceae bacterium]|jgi:hypothetical protein|nr:hypothetical protein [Polyangiaceae bacterium]